MREADREMLGEVADDLMDSFLVLSRRLSRELPHPGGRKFDPSRFVLKKVEELGPVRMSEICRNTGISKPHMTVLVNKLILEGLVERVAHPEDRRVVVIRMTAAGRGFHKEVTRAVRETVMNYLSSLDTEDISTLHDSMKNMRAVISKLEGSK